MLKEDCFELGHVTKLHGYKGAVKFFLDTDDPKAYSKLESLFLEISGNLTPFFIKSIKIQKNQAILDIEGVDTIEKAQSLIKAPGFLPLTMLPSLDENHFYFHEVIGFDVVDREEGAIGKIIEVLDLQPNVLLQVDMNGTELLIPTNDEVQVKVDRAAKTITLSTPPGLLAMYKDA